MRIRYLRCLPRARADADTVTEDAGEPDIMPFGGGIPFNRFALSFQVSSNGSCLVNKATVKLAITAAAGSPLSCNRGLAQLLPPAPKAASVTITQGSTLELAHDGEAIIRWTTNNPSGSDAHYGIIKYDTSPNNLDQTANSPIRLNRGHPDAIFRVSIIGLNPQTIYYYKVTSMAHDGTSDPVESPVNQFTMPAAGQ
jgi:Purple acid Phosphatase, N-terminal domain